MESLKSTIILAIVAVTIISCGGGTNNLPHNAEGFTGIENELKNKFGENAYYTDILITHDENIGNLVSITVTDAPETMKMGQWNLMQNSWTQTSEVLLEVPEGNKAADFMFQLDEKINLNKFGELVEKSSKQLTVEKNLENPSLSTALITFPKNGDISDIQYSITLKPKNGGTSFHFYYKLNGELIEMDY